MSLSREDEKRLFELFAKKEQCDVNSDEHIRYRNEIFTDVFVKLERYFSILKREWKTKFHISEEDGASIINDGLLAAVSSFTPGYTKKKREVRFLTYLVAILMNRVKNYITLNYASGVRAKRKFHKMPLDSYISLDQLTSHQAKNREPYDSDEFQEKYCEPIYRFLSEKTEDRNNQQDYKFVVEKILQSASETDRIILKAILDGYTLRETASKVNLTATSVKYRLHQLAKKFQTVQDELCQ